MLERCLVDFVNIICKEGSLNLNPRPQIKIEITDDVDEKDVIAEQRSGLNPCSMCERPIDS